MTVKARIWLWLSRKSHQTFLLFSILVACYFEMIAVVPNRRFGGDLFRVKRENLKGVKSICLKAKAGIWPWLSYLCQICSKPDNLSTKLPRGNLLDSSMWFRSTSSNLCLVAALEVRLAFFLWLSISLSLSVFLPPSLSPCLPLDLSVSLLSSVYLSLSPVINLRALFGANLVKTTFSIEGKRNPVVRGCLICPYTLTSNHEQRAFKAGRVPIP